MENKALVNEMQLYKDNDPGIYKAKGEKKKVIFIHDNDITFIV